MAEKIDPSQYTKFERTRVIGARALQISMGAPPLVDVKSNVTDPLAIAKMEFEAGKIPISIRRKMPKRLDK